MPDRQERSAAFWLLLPAMLGIGLFTVLPMLGTLGLSFMQWDLLGSPKWVGLGNYTDLAADPLFYKVMGQTALFVILYVGLDIGLALGLAAALDKQRRGAAILRAAYFLPVVTSMVAGAILWGWLLDPRYGMFNALLAPLGLGPVRWLSDPRWALPTLVVVSVWKHLGYDMLLILAGLQGIPSSQLEAASLDGAGPWARFRHVTLPMLAPTLVMVGMLATIRGFQTFDTVYLLTEGGPQRSTTTIGFWLFQNAFTFFKLGKASALAYTIFFVLAGLSALQWHYYRRREGQEG
ncbi:MAG: sugar ABC transporter permease [Candidatus Sericytochromatia bacterium]|nr:sugar ABC transporter permease [Candidatus Sericytochromatia bacterium]